MAITIEKGPRPAVVAGRGRRTSELREAAAKLGPGEWFYWDKAPKFYRAPIAKLVKDGLKIDAYIGPDNRVVVHHTGDAPQASSDVKLSVTAAPSQKAAVVTRHGASEVNLSPATIKPIPIEQPAKGACILPAAAKESPEDLGTLEARIMKVLSKVKRPMSKEELLMNLDRTNWPGQALANLREKALIEFGGHGGTTRVWLTVKGIEEAGAQ